MRDVILSMSQDPWGLKMGQEVSSGLRDLRVGVDDKRRGTTVDHCHGEMNLTPSPPHGRNWETTYVIRECKFKTKSRAMSFSLHKIFHM